MNDPTRHVDDLSAPKAYSYRAVCLDMPLEGYATLHRSTTRNDGRYTMSSGISKRSKGAMGHVQAARAAQLEQAARAALINAAIEAGWTAVTLDGHLGPEVYWYAPCEPVPAAVVAELVPLEELEADDDQVVVDLLNLEAGAAAVPQVAPPALVGKPKARKGWYAVPLAEAIAVAEPPCELIYPLDPTPTAIAELGAQCRRCGCVHDVMGRITGDVIWCPCGCQHTVRFPARVVKGGE